VDVTECVDVDDVGVCWGEDEILDRLELGLVGCPAKQGLNLPR
jgi:hypothetical protein